MRRKITGRLFPVCNLGVCSRSKRQDLVLNLELEDCDARRDDTKCKHEKQFVLENLTQTRRDETSRTNNGQEAESDDVTTSPAKAGKASIRTRRGRAGRDSIVLQTVTVQQKLCNEM